MSLTDRIADWLFSFVLDDLLDRALVRASFSIANGPTFHIENLGRLQTSINAVGYYDKNGKDALLAPGVPLPIALPGRSEIFIPVRQDDLSDAAHAESLHGGAITGFWVRTLGMRYKRAHIDPQLLWWITPRGGV